VQVFPWEWTWQRPERKKDLDSKKQKESLEIDGRIRVYSIPMTTTITSIITGNGDSTWKYSVFADQQRCKHKRSQ
jgi:hypothetical protein